MRRQFCLCCLRCFWPPRGRNNCRCLSLVKWRLIKLDKGERNSYLTKTFWCFESAFIRGDWVVRFLCKVLRHVTCTLHKRIGSGHSLTSIWDFERFPNKFSKWQQFARQGSFCKNVLRGVRWQRGGLGGQSAGEQRSQGQRLESQTSEVSGGRHSMLGILEMTGQYIGYWQHSMLIFGHTADDRRVYWKYRHWQQIRVLGVPGDSV